jgi:hypothetical protein
MPFQFIPSGILEKLNGLQMSQVFFKIQLYRLASSSGQILKKHWVSHGCSIGALQVLIKNNGCY